MGFKLGTAKKLEASSGEIKSKFRFGKEKGDADISIPGNPVIRKSLPNDVLAEANMDGSIYLNKSVKPGSLEERQILLHEMRHATDIKIGKLEYGDDYVKWNGETFPRETRDGKDMIKIDGKWKEAGDEDFPWEYEANHGNSTDKLQKFK